MVSVGAVDMWPLLLDEGGLARMLSFTRPAVRRLVRRGILPAPRDLDGLERWHRDEVRARLSQVYGLDELNSRREADRRAALEALDAWTVDNPTAVRRGQQGEGKAVPVLPPGRQKSGTPRTRGQRGIPV